jgi:hypothetical protein
LEEELAKSIQENSHAYQPAQSGRGMEAFVEKLCKPLDKEMSQKCRETLTKGVQADATDEYAREYVDRKLESITEPLAQELRQRLKDYHPPPSGGGVRTFVKNFCNSVQANHTETQGQVKLSRCEDLLGANTGNGEQLPSSTLLGLINNLASEADKILEENVTMCMKEFPSSLQWRQPVPLSSVYAMWYQPLEGETDENWRNWTAVVRRRSNVDFHAITVERAPGQPITVDAKMGVTKPLQTVLLAVRDPASPPIVEMKVYHVKQGPKWNAVSGESRPTDLEYDHTIMTAMQCKDQQCQKPVGLVPGSSCQRTDPTTHERCEKFADRFSHLFNSSQHRAAFADSVRAGGYVDLGMACSTHVTAGRNESLVFGGGKTQIFLSTRSGYDLPPIVEFRLSSDGFDKRLGEQKFARVPQDMNKECANSLLNSHSYLYYRRNWVTRSDYQSTMQEVKKVNLKVDECLQTAQPVLLGHSQSMVTNRRCLRCVGPKWSTRPHRGQIKTYGLVDGYLDLGWIDHANFSDETKGTFPRRTARQVDPTGEVRRKRIVFVGEITVQRKGKHGPDGSAVYDCEPSGVGKLWSLTQSLEVARSDRKVKGLVEKFNKGSVLQSPKPGSQLPLDDFDEEHQKVPQPPEADSGSATSVDWEDSGKSYIAAWRTTPRAGDYYFTGEVHRYGDFELFDQKYEVPAKSAIELMCQDWKERQKGVNVENEGAVAAALKHLEARSFQRCLSDVYAAGTRPADTILEHCYLSQPFTKDNLELFLSKSEFAAPSTLAKMKILAANHELTYSTQELMTVPKENEPCSYKAFTQYKDRGWKMFSRNYAFRRLTLRRDVLITTSCQTSKVQTFILKNAKLSADIEFMAASWDELTACFVLTAHVVEYGNTSGAPQALKLCAPNQLAMTWHRTIGQAIIDTNIGPFHTDSKKWLETALKLKCATSGSKLKDEQAVPMAEEGAKLEHRSVPDGFGNRWYADPACNQDGLCKTEHLWRGVSRGKFSKGVDVGLTERRGWNASSDDKNQQYRMVGHFRRGVMSFGTSVLRHSSIQGAQMLREAKEIVEQPSSLYAPQTVIYTGCWLQTDDGQLWPAHIGTLRDDKLQPLYWGQFALWLPWGLGVWVDQGKKVMFRGVLKKEYRKFQIGTNTAEYVPLLAGELMRLDADKPISDDDVLRFDGDNSHLPGTLMHTAQLYFGDGEPVGTLQPRCVSKALFKWEEWLELSRRLIGVWTAISDGTDFDYRGRLRVSAEDDDIFREGREVKKLLESHANQLVRLRIHLKRLVEEQPLQVREAEDRLRGAVELLTEAAVEGREYNEWENHWIDRTRNRSYVLHIAQQLAKLGPSAYVQFDTMQSFIDGANYALDFASSSYCVMCSDRQGEDVGRTRIFPKLKVKMTEVRGVESPTKGGTFALVVTVGTASAKQTSFREVKRGVVKFGRRDNTYMIFDGMEQRLEASTWVSCQLLYDDGVTKTVVADVKYRLISIVGRRGEYEWVQMNRRSEIKDFYQKDAEPEVQIALEVKNTAGIAGVGSHHILPIGCGATYSVRRLIERNEARLRLVELKVNSMRSTAESMAVDISQQNFDSERTFDPKAEQLVPNTAYDPPRARIEDTMHEDVFGKVDTSGGSCPAGTPEDHCTSGGIWSPEGPSVTVLTETANNTHRPEESLRGPYFFSQYIRLSNPAQFGA